MEGKQMGADGRQEEGEAYAEGEVVVETKLCGTEIHTHLHVPTQPVVCLMVISWCVFHGHPHSSPCSHAAWCVSHACLMVCLMAISRLISVLPAACCVSWCTLSTYCFLAAVRASWSALPSLCSRAARGVRWSVPMILLCLITCFMGRGCLRERANMHPAHGAWSMRASWYTHDLFECRVSHSCLRKHANTV